MYTSTITEKDEIKETQMLLAHEKEIILLEIENEVTAFDDALHDL